MLRNVSPKGLTTLVFRGFKMERKRLYVKNHGQWVEVFYLGQMNFRFNNQLIVNDLFDYDYKWEDI